jgi:DNA (cytosine-5)-methyltransferase 1
MLRTLSDLGYGIEWRIINAAEYGFPQRRRRIYIFGFHKTTQYYKSISKINTCDIFNTAGIFAKSFPIQSYDNISYFNVSQKKYASLLEVSNDFRFNFKNYGILLKSNIYTANITAKLKDTVVLETLLQKNQIPENCFITTQQEEKFKYLKGSKKVPRTSKAGVKYIYSEGAMCFPDSLNMPGRTMLTSEGTVNRSTHVVRDITTKKLRILTPIEAERLNQFPDNWTNTGMTNRKRYFMMGNALVCGVIKELGFNISDIINKEN